MKKYVWLSLFLSSAALAGKFEIIGEGTASKTAEFIRVNIEVRSECHSSALSARKAVDDLTTNALTVLHQFRTNLPEQISTSPQANIQKIKTAYINNENVIICNEDHSWTSSTMIQFKLEGLQQLAQVQDALLNLNGPTPTLAQLNAERLSIVLSKPTGGVLADTWDNMSDLALQRAHQNALRQVKVLTLGMLNPKIELIKVAPTTDSSGQLIYDRVDSEGDTTGVSLGNVSVKLARQFVFKVEGQ